MKVYFSVDMEGISAVAAREEVTMGNPEYAAAQARMTRETRLACDAAYEAGATEIVVKDAHWTGRNLDPAAFEPPPGKGFKLIRGWSGHPFSMVQELDASFAAVAFLGYHAAAGRAGNPLAHTLSSRLLASIRINDRLASEFLIYSYAASLVGVPVALVAGDKALCDEARALNETIVTVDTFEGHGDSIVALAPATVEARLREAVREAIGRRRGRTLPLPSRFRVVVDFHDHAQAYRRSFYPGARPAGDHGVELETDAYFEVLRFLRFMTL